MSWPHETGKADVAAATLHQVVDVLGGSIAQAANRKDGGESRNNPRPVRTLLAQAFAAQRL